MDPRPVRLELRGVSAERLLESFAVRRAEVGGEVGFLDTLDVAANGARIPFQDIIPRNTMVFDYTGLPALMLPSGVGETGLSVAIQIVGKSFSDGLCLAVGAAFQRLTDHHLMKPPKAA